MADSPNTPSTAPVTIGSDDGCWPDADWDDEPSLGDQPDADGDCDRFQAPTLAEELAGEDGCR